MRCPLARPCRNPDPDCSHCETLAEQQADPDYVYSQREQDAMADRAAAREAAGRWA